MAILKYVFKNNLNTLLSRITFIPETCIELLKTGLLLLCWLSFFSFFIAFWKDFFLSLLEKKISEAKSPKLQGVGRWILQVSGVHLSKNI